MKKFILLIFILLFVSCEKSSKKYENSKFLYGTMIKIIVYEKNIDKAKKAINSSFKEMERIENEYSSYKEKSIIHSFNKKPLDKLELDPEGQYIFDKIHEIYMLSNKKYDITIDPLLDLWGFNTEELKLDQEPNVDSIKNILSNEVGFHNIKYENMKLHSLNKNININTGSFLKGYGIKKGKEILEKEGISSALISSLSSVDTIGVKPNGEEWKIGIENPFDSTKRVILNTKNKSIGVSGDYQTYVEIENKKYHHIFDIDTGYPVRDKKMVVVLCENTFLGDLYSTAFFVMDIEKVLEFVNSKDDIEVMIIDNDLERHFSSNFSNYLSI